MTTRADIEEAMRQGPAHRFSLRGHIRIREDATAAQKEIAGLLLNAPDPAAYDKAAALPAVNQLFVSGVLYLGAAR